METTGKRKRRHTEYTFKITNTDMSSFMKCQIKKSKIKRIISFTIYKKNNFLTCRNFVPIDRKCILTPAIFNSLIE